MTPASVALFAPRWAGAHAGEDRGRGGDGGVPRRRRPVRELRAVHTARLDPPVRRRRRGRLRVARNRYVLPSAREQFQVAQSRSAVLSHLSAAVAPRVEGEDGAERDLDHRAPQASPARGAAPRHTARRGPSCGPTTCATASRRRSERCSTAPGPSRSTRPLPSPTPPCAPATSIAESSPKPLPTCAATGARAARRVAAAMPTRRAANPFESVLRALCHRRRLRPHASAPGRGVRALRRRRPRQRGAPAGGRGRGFEHHGTRRGLRKDCRRHTEFAVFGWSSLRFSFEDVMYEQPWVRWALRSWRDVREGRVPADPPRRSRQQAVAS